MVNEKRLIDANALMDDVEMDGALYACLGAVDDVRFLVDSQPTVDAVEVVHGKWEMGVDEGDYDYGTCSVCGYNEYNAFCCLLPHNYCPNCGAKMDGDENEID